MVPIPKLDDNSNIFFFTPVHLVKAYSFPTCCTHSKTRLKFIPEAYCYVVDMVATCWNVLDMAKPRERERERTGSRPTPLSFP